jgi:hypothetical protein
MALVHWYIAVLYEAGQQTAVYMTAPEKNGTPTLPRWVGSRGMLPSPFSFDGLCSRPRRIP